MDAPRFDRLTNRQRACLRGVRALKGSKEIAEELGIEKSTVDGYLTEAVKLLGARNRRDAAIMLAAHEDVGAPPEPRESAAFSAPDKMGGHSARLFEPAVALSSIGAPEERTATDQPQGSTLPTVAIGLPFRGKGRRNDLSVGSRLIWIPVIAVGLTVAFGMLASGLQVLTDLLEAISRHLS